MTAVLPAAPAVDAWTAWDRFLERSSETGFMQSSWWADFRATNGYRHFGATIRDRGEILGGAMVLRYSYSNDSCFYCLPEGPVLPRNEESAAEVFAAVLAAIEDRRNDDVQRVSHLRI